MFPHICKHVKIACTLHQSQCHNLPEFALQIADMLVAAKADDVCILDVSSLCGFTEHMVLATGRSHRHIQAAAHAVAHQVCQHHCCYYKKAMLCIHHVLAVLYLYT